MQRKPKEVTLKADTIADINSGIFDTDLFIQRLSDYRNRANKLYNTKLDSLDSTQLFEALNSIFTIYFDKEDYLKMLSIKHHNHYIKYMNIKTNMYDGDNNIRFFV